MVFVATNSNFTAYSFPSPRFPFLLPPTFHSTFEQPSTPVSASNLQRMHNQTNATSQQQISNNAINRPSEPNRTRSTPTSSGASHRPDLVNGRGGKKSVSFGGNSTRGTNDGYRKSEQATLGTVAERGETAGPFKMDKTEREMYAALKASQEEDEVSLSLIIRIQ